MTRLESSARDYAIACLATGDSVVDVLDWWYHGADLAYWRSQWVEGKTPRVPWRILRARVALYLRLLRRVEAWERRERWAEWRWHAVRAWDAEERLTMVAQAAPWRPLWTSAPHFDPQITARMRRER